VKPFRPEWHVLEDESGSAPDILNIQPDSAFCGENTDFSDPALLLWDRF
jgi:hypothetical protein